MLEGWRHTLLTRHAPTVSYWQNDFDCDLVDLLNKSNMKPENSTKEAIAFLSEMANKLPKPPG